MVEPTGHGDQPSKDIQEEGKSDMTLNQNPQPENEVAATPPDLLSQMIQIGLDNKEPHMQKLLDGIARVEQRANISVRNYLGFGAEPDAILRYYNRMKGQNFIGELNTDNNLEGRGIKIWAEGDIFIRQWNDGLNAPGHFITIYRGGQLDVGECFLKEGELCEKGTAFYSNGTSEEYESR